MELTEIFWTFFVGTIAGLIFGLFKMCLKSKCDNVSCCCIKIHRNVEQEVREHEMDIKNNITSPKAASNSISRFDL